jgi:hypothetical protein
MTPKAEVDESAISPTSTVLPIAGCLLVCAQFENIAAMLTLEQYTSRHGENASVGEHLRHSVEHFTILLNALPHGPVDYDARKRNADLERCPLALISTVRSIVAQLSSLDTTFFTRPLFVHMLFAPNTEKIDVPSTLSRELGFVASHATHHLAIVKLLLQSFGTSLPSEYGVGNATLTHRSQQARSFGGA